MTKKLHLRKFSMLLSIALFLSFFFQASTTYAAEPSKTITEATDEIQSASTRANYYQYSGYVDALHRQTFYMGQSVSSATVVYAGKPIDGGSCTATIRFDYKTSFTVNLNSTAGKFYINIPKGNHTIEVMAPKTCHFTISIF